MGAVLLLLTAVPSNSVIFVMLCTVLGFVAGGAQAWQGKTIMVADPVRDNFIEAEIVSPHMFDAKGDRQHG